MSELSGTTGNQVNEQAKGDGKVEEKKPRDPSDRFKVVAVTRTNKIISCIDDLGMLASTKNYSYTTEQVDKIFEAIQQELEIVKQCFLESKTVRKVFTLD